MKHKKKHSYLELISPKASSSVDDNYRRKSGTREENKISEELPKIVFSLKDFDSTNTIGQTFIDWQEKSKLLAYMMDKIGYICQKNIIEAKQEKFIKIYGDFPPNSKFKHPSHIVSDAKWAVIMKIKGQKGRVVGHIIDNVFYIVFLDKNHDFYPSEKKNT